MRSLKKLEAQSQKRSTRTCPMRTERMSDEMRAHLKEFGERVHIERFRRRQSLRAVAAATGLSFNVLCRIERGDDHHASSYIALNWWLEDGS